MLPRTSNRLGDYLRSLREARGLTLRELSYQIKRTDAYINRLETGKRRTGLRYLWKLVTALDGDFYYALALLCADEGLPDEIVQQIASGTPASLANKE